MCFTAALAALALTTPLGSLEDRIAGPYVSYATNGDLGTVWLQLNRDGTFKLHKKFAPYDETLEHGSYMTSEIKLAKEEVPAITLRFIDHGRTYDEQPFVVDLQSGKPMIHNFLTLFLCRPEERRRYLAEVAADKARSAKAGP